MIVGAGIGGLGAAIAISLAGDRVTVLEAGFGIGEVISFSTFPHSPLIVRSLKLDRSEQASKSYPTPQRS